MSTEPTTEMMNEAIALFINMELKQDMDDPGFEWEWINAPKGLHWPSKTLPPFNTSWDWLMPVWKKAAKILYEIRNQLSKDDYLEAHKVTKSFIDACQKVEIDKAHDAVYRAILGITWYNDNQQKQTNGSSSES